MTKRFYIGSLKVILIFKLFLISLGVSAQVLKKPVLDFTSACGSRSFNNFTFKFDFSGSPFDVSNEFIVQLSDANGSFDNAVEMGRITGQNFTYFNIAGSINLPTGTYGKSYKLRIKSTMPETLSPESDSFEAYYITSQVLVLNNYTPVYLCDANATTISLNDIGENAEYNWYRNGSLISGERGTSITVNQSGEYYAAIDYGACGDVVKSNKVNAQVFNSSNVRIQGGSVVELCGSDTYEFVSSIDNSAYTYKWYKDGVLIPDLPDYSPKYTTGTSDQYGEYHVEVKVSDDCKIETQKVTIKEPEGSGFTVEAVGDLNRVFLPEETIVLSVTHSATSPSYQWYKDGVALPARNQIEMNAIEEGVYYVEITDNSTSCPTTKKSSDYTVLKITDLVTSINADDEYVDCESPSTKLIISQIKGKATDGNEYELSAEQIAKLNFQWFKDNQLITDATNNEYEVLSYNENGEYYVNVSVSVGFNGGGSIGIIGPFNDDSNKLNVLLTNENIELESSSQSNTLCPGGSVTLSTTIFAGFNYSWLKGEESISVSDPSSIEVTEVGAYALVVEGFGCTKRIDIKIIEFNDDAVKISPSTTAVLGQNGTVEITASGGESYEWYDDDDNLLSTTDSVEVSELGTYTLVAKSGICDVIKEIEVVEDDGNLIIPNIVSPFNADGINDTWQIPNKYAFQQNVNIVIYDSRGKEVLNTTDYQNNWPEEDAVKGGMLFYFKVIRDQTLIKAGTLSVLK